MNDELMERLLKVINPFVLSSLEEIVAFDKKSDSERQEIMEVALRSLEIATVVATNFYDSEHINSKKLSSVEEAILNGDFQKAASLIK